MPQPSPFLIIRFTLPCTRAIRASPATSANRWMTYTRVGTSHTDARTPVCPPPLTSMALEQVFATMGSTVFFHLHVSRTPPLWSTHTGLTLSLFKDISASKKTFSYAETRRKIVHGDMTGACACVCVRVCARVGVLAGTEH